MVVLLKDIARIAGVDISTVSRVINGNPGISEKKRRHVRKVLAKLKYHPNASARKLRLGKTNAIGVFVRGMKIDEEMGTAALKIMRGIRERSNEIGRYDVTLQLSVAGGADFDYTRYFHEKRLDGIILIFMGMEDQGIQELEEEGSPAVFIGSSSGKHDYVRSDSYAGAAAVIDHLIKLGRRRIGMIRVKRDDQIDNIDRYRAYKDILFKRGIAYDETLVARDEHSEERYVETTGYGAMNKILSAGPDAVFAYNDRAALGAMRAVNDAGLIIPRDIAVAGFDNIPEAERQLPGLTTMEQEFAALGRAAVDILVRRIENQPPGQQKKIFPTRLIVRGSTVAGL